jgi:hypothetical protein
MKNLGTAQADQAGASRQLSELFHFTMGSQSIIGHESDVAAKEFAGYIFRHEHRH